MEQKRDLRPAGVLTLYKGVEKQASAVSPGAGRFGKRSILADM
jgi:hypothetical protein